MVSQKRNWLISREQSRVNA